MSACRQFTIFFVTPEGETHSAKIELSSTCSALADDAKLDQVLSEALERWEAVCGVQIIDVAAAAKPARVEPEAQVS